MIFPVGVIKPILLIVAHHLIKNSDIRVKLDILLYEKYKFNIDVFNSKIKNIQINDKENNNFLDLFYNVKNKFKTKTQAKKSYCDEHKTEIKEIKYKIDYPQKPQSKKIVRKNKNARIS